MTSSQYRAAIDRLGLSQRAAGRFLGVNERTVRNWIAGTTHIPKAVEMILEWQLAILDGAEESRRKQELNN